MKSREVLIRAKRFKVEEKRRQVGQIESMIAEFERMAKDLDDQVAAEQERSGIHDADHFAYPTFAKAAIQRRDNLIASISELRGRLNVAEGECSEAIEELAKYQAIAERDQERHADRAPGEAA
jgi:flagellar protein FliJ